ncbi:hypothetical protein E2C01_034837 [Portunus trituberculatus]|uniref:Uncharacterized protein n=1 Tax=Portunus trituberculatus TaxID=210409 RepID=A0A5B7F7P4_PORTR|nr:hypothetical protein [Portunus trituberculatus]
MFELRSEIEYVNVPMRSPDNRGELETCPDNKMKPRRLNFPKLAQFYASFIKPLPTPPASVAPPQLLPD